MARRPSPTLTEAEYRLMDILWDLGNATVAEIHARLDDHPIAYTTVLSTLTILERKGYVRHTVRGKANVYKPRVERDTARLTVIDNVLATFFGGSAHALMLNLLDSEKLSPDEERRLRALLEAER
ncbi:MarR family transcriptional regulator [Vulcanimicrobium alpinum]|uniref:MarR family transcriptional regulator n=1 Tax=Vulcanimicrobium alpinum TaxID=3016050 RepID=A0AAN2C8J4_UNVUL|nr:BlaI/MecI/CopY family transcriptional regulator [Vulcanimicrobium alpinum]BDE05354.1 MarR family transcriptional regulator [Vulcanimicrobium alpinum]